jgi:hypothetical protein
MTFQFTINDPFSEDKFVSLYGWDRKLTKNKAVEFQISNGDQFLFSINVDIRFSGRDHAGPSISVSIFHWEIALRFYDVRHWDDEKNDWENQK